MPAPKSTAQAVDTVKTVDLAPPSTSRPILVTNRPMMTNDPMLSVPTDTATEKPSGQPIQTAQASSGETPINREAPHIAPIHNESAVLAEDPVGTDSSSAEHVPQPKDSIDEPLPGESDREKSTIPDESEVAQPTQDTDQGQHAQKSDTGPSSDSGSKSSDTTTASDRDLELEQIIAKGTFAVSIGQGKRRRRKRIVITLCILFVTVMVLDVLLDLGILDIPTIPHTNLLNRSS